MLAKSALLAVISAIPVLAQAADDGAAFFEKNIRPILVAKCIGCHSSASQPVMGGLKLDTRDDALKGGSRGASIVPGKPTESLLLKAVLHSAGALKMPPGPKMKDPDAALLAQWIQMGAPWGKAAVASSAPKEKYWAFVPPRIAPGGPDSIDAFLNAGRKGISPAKPADKRTLLRRASYDLTGLPPTPAEVRAFLDDHSPDAYAKVVDRLLASPRYGERWGRHWLDVARYADSNGLDENLVYKNAYRYRDYVIAAFNKDKPFDQFLTEQLAGDLLPTATGDAATQYERWTATGFLSLGAKMLAEDDPKKMEMDIVDEQLDTTMRAFNGLTVGCARCHDHKFDPIPTADYYSLAGIFKSSKTMENFKVVAKWHEYVLAPKEDRDRLTAHEAKLEAKRKEIAAITKTENDRLAAIGMERMGSYLLAAAHVQRDQGVQVAPVEVEKGAIVRAAGSFDKGNAPRVLEKKKTNVPKDVKGPYFAEYSIEVPAAGEYQLDLLDEEKGAGTADLYVNGEWQSKGKDPVQNREASPEAGGWSYIAIVPLRKGANTIRLEHASRFPYFEKLLIAKNTLATVPLTRVQIARKYDVNPGYLENLVEYLRRSSGATASPLYAWETLADQAQAPALAAKYEADVKEAQKAGKGPLYDFLHEKFGPFRAPPNARRYYLANVREQLTRLDEELKSFEGATPEFPRAMGVTEGEKIDDLGINIRGSHWNIGTKQPRRFLRVIAGDAQTPVGPETSGRLQLAQWMTGKDHPLTSRVMVNRLWRYHFGRGIVPTTDNFGRLGEKPSNQPLLDWLAVKFVDQGWSMKKMHRLMMLSNTYQMSSDYDPKSFEADPENILLWRMPRRRLEAEEIRDGIMTVSGGLDHGKAGGTILKYKDRQYVANTSKGGDIDYDRTVRAVYIPVVRSSMYDVFRAFDLPDPSTTNGDRDATVVAPQALFMMNSSVMLQHSARLAERLLKLETDDAGRVREAYEAAMARPPTAQEIDQAQTFVARMQQEWKADKTKAWQSFCKSLLSANEFIYIN